MKPTEIHRTLEQALNLLASIPFVPSPHFERCMTEAVDAIERLMDEPEAEPPPEPHQKRFPEGV